MIETTENEQGFILLFPVTYFVILSISHKGVKVMIRRDDDINKVHNETENC